MNKHYHQDHEQHKQKAIHAMEQAHDEFGRLKAYVEHLRASAATKIAEARADASVTKEDVLNYLEAAIEQGKKDEEDVVHFLKHGSKK